MPPANCCCGGIMLILFGINFLWDWDGSWKISSRMLWLTWLRKKVDIIKGAHGGSRWNVPPKKYFNLRLSPPRQIFIRIAGSTVTLNHRMIGHFVSPKSYHNKNLVQRQESYNCAQKCSKKPISLHEIDCLVQWKAEFLAGLAVKWHYWPIFAFLLGKPI